MAVSLAALFALTGASLGRAQGPLIAPVAHPVVPMGVMPLAAHRAVYNVTLLRSFGAKSPISAHGRVSYEFTGTACDGYSQVFRQLTEIQPSDGEARLSDMRSATFEDGEGATFSFDVKTTVDNNPPDVVDGRASKKKNDVLAIELSKPSSQTVSVGSDVLFPTAHLKRIIEAAKAGQRLLTVKVFDGSDDGKKVYDTLTVIGHVLTAPAADQGAARNPALDHLARWPVTISYFEQGHTDAEPVYTLGFELYENGISRALRFDYGDFVLAGELTSIEMLPAKPCRK